MIVELQISFSSRSGVIAMRPIIFVLLVFGVILSLASGCAMTGQASAAENSGKGAIMLKQSDSGKTVDAQVGEIIEVSLKENPSTGYRWAIDQGDGQIAQMHGTEYHRGTSANAMGAGGQRIFSFIMKRAGRVTVRLKLWQAWEGDTSVVERFDINIDVKP